MTMQSPVRAPRPRRLRGLVALASALVLVAAVLAAGPAHAAVPAGFVDTLITAVSSPTALAFTPDGRMLITQKGGTLRVFQNGALLGTAALTLNVCQESERGLLGVAVDPSFATNGFIYLFYTAQTGSCVNRVSRFTMTGNTASAASELILVDNMPSPGGNHNAGDVQFGRDGFLYITIGDGGTDYAGNSGSGGANDAARDRHVLTGKVLRITSTGGIPASNPFQGAGTARCNTGPTTAGNTCQEIYATGLRNPFRLAFDPNDAGTRFFINDVGQNAWEEIDLGQSGADYGWNCREGAHTNSSTGLCSPTPPGLVNPIFEYQHNTTVPGTTAANCHSITGGAFVPNGIWPGFDGTYLFSDFICGWIFRLSPGPTFTASDFATSLGGSSAVTLQFGPFGSSQALYYTTFAGGGQVRRIHHRLQPQVFHTVTPCRVVDTRDPAGPLGGPALAGGATRSFTLAGTCGIPASARAVALNLTAVGATAAGHLTAFPAGGTVPATATLNFGTGQTRANNAVLELGTTGGLSVLCALPSGQSTHLTIDVVGYFD